MSITKTLLTEKQLKILEQAGITGKATRKQLAFVKFLLENPKSSATQAVIEAYDPQSYGSARALASENLTKPNVLAILQDASEEAEGVLSSVMRRADRFSASNDKVGASYASVARAAANDILDRVHGKATQRTESITAVVTINMDLTATTDAK